MKIKFKNNEGQIQIKRIIIDTTVPIQMKVTRNIENFENQLDQLFEIYEQKINRTVSILDEEFQISLNQQNTKNETVQSPIVETQENHKTVHKYEEEGLKSKTKSLYGSTCFTKEKENGDLRVLIDFRELNHITKITTIYFLQLLMNSTKWPTILYSQN
ncbi:hypothetical protein M153_3040006601 [Pseudoloma neurophilia]|uniref:Uncharacterized protein n=1 Tax=Pseudoloma neurophilia TaxID=146866 RepID=A0A0R0M5V5_9MICR|nr:hypothetical protein M153_3040006601 [Pseudoloma neurophilia]